MRKRHTTHHRHRLDAASKVRSRRLAIESMESRLLLSGTQLDYTIWNLDSLQANYAVISQGGTLPRAPSSTSSGGRATGAPVDVDWVVVPGMTLSPADAAALSYRHYRDAMSQGVVDFQQSSALFQEWQAGFSADPTGPAAAIYAVGIRYPSPPPAIGGLGDPISVGGTLSTDTTFSLNPTVDLIVPRSTIPSLDPRGTQHGTAVAGLIGTATSPNSIGVNGSSFTVYSGSGIFTEDLHLREVVHGGLGDLYVKGSTSLDVVGEWDSGISGQEVVVSVIDSGVEDRHIDLDDFGVFTPRSNDAPGSIFVDTGPDADIGLTEVVTNADADVNGQLASNDSEGGEISIHSLIDIENSPDLAGPENKRIAAWDAGTDAPTPAAEDQTAPADEEVTGELARAIVFDVIDGQSPPVLYAAVDSANGDATSEEYVGPVAGVAAGPASATMYRQTADGAAGRPAAASATTAAAADSASRPPSVIGDWSRVRGAANAWLTTASAAVRAAIAEVAAAVPGGGSPIHAAPRDLTDRNEAFSQWGTGDQISPQRKGSYTILAASPLLALLAAERLLAAREKRHQFAQPDALKLSLTNPPEDEC
jgi:hypothetical protein